MTRLICRTTGSHTNSSRTFATCLQKSLRDASRHSLLSQVYSSMLRPYPCCRRALSYPADVRSLRVVRRTVRLSRNFSDHLIQRTSPRCYTSHRIKQHVPKHSKVFDGAAKARLPSDLAAAQRPRRRAQLHTGLVSAPLAIHHTSRGEPSHRAKLQKNVELLFDCLHRQLVSTIDGWKWVHQQRVILSALRRISQRLDTTEGNLRGHAWSC